MTRWYRAYVGTVNDPKLAGVAHRYGVSKCVVIAIWHFILERAAEANAKGTYKMDGHQVCATLDLDMETVKNVWAGFIEAGMVSDKEVIAWKKRQYETDITDPTNAQRQRRWKEKHLGNGKVTETKRPDTDTDTEKNNKKIEKVEFDKSFLEFYLAYPKKMAKKDAAKAYSQARREVSHETIMAGLSWASKHDSRWRDSKYIPYPASWLRSGGYEDGGGILEAEENKNRFKAYSDFPEFKAWMDYYEKRGESGYIREMKQRELEGRQFSFPSQWPPEQ